MLVVGAMALKNKRDLREIERYRSGDAQVHKVERAIATRGQDAIIVFGDSIVSKAPLPLQACGTQLVNAGIGGARSSELIPLIENMVSTNIRPKRIIIAVGVNDAALDSRNQASFAVTYEALLRLSASIAPTLVATVAPINTQKDRGILFSSNSRDRVNETIVATAAKLSIPILRLDDLHWQTIDGIHPTNYDGWISRVAAALCD
jgi:lysophospholipase L1-like esterase